jgi:hypothetical protein
MWSVCLSLLALCADGGKRVFPTNWSNGSESTLYAAAYLMTRLHLLRVRLSALMGSAVHRTP